ncbi:hypothetical protein CR513_23740, partial [Mucuna pruriens]
MAIDTRDKKQSALWWESYGGEGKELQRVVMRILSLTCSVMGCERNWCTFDQMHTKRRNQLEVEKRREIPMIQYACPLLNRMMNESPIICLSDV